MNPFKKYTALLAVFALLLGLCACGGSSDNNSEASATQAQEEESEAEKARKAAIQARIDKAEAQKQEEANKSSEPAANDSASPDPSTPSAPTPSTSTPSAPAATTTTPAATPSTSYTAPTTPTTPAAPQASPPAPSAEPEESVSLPDVQNEIISSLNVKEYVELDSSRLLDQYGIQQADLAQSACFVTMSGTFPHEVIMVEAVDEAASQRIAGQLQKRLNEVLNQSASYDAETHALAQSCTVDTNGLVVSMFLSPDSSAMRQILTDSLA